jgi:hypothetical protein
MGKIHQKMTAGHLQAAAGLGRVDEMDKTGIFRDV